MSGQIKVELLRCMASDRFIAEGAWTSSNSRAKVELKTDEQVTKLVKELAEEGHGVPFEHCIFTFWIKNAIALDRHLVKHRVASHSGMSGRYRTMPSEYLDVPDDVMDIIDRIPIMNSVPLNGNGRITGDPNHLAEYYRACETANNIYKFAAASAKHAKETGHLTNSEYKRFREFFRGILPQHNMTETVFTINLRSLANLFKLRKSGTSAQKEIQQVADEMYRLVKESNTIPVAFEVLDKKGWVI